MKRQSCTGESTAGQTRAFLELHFVPTDENLWRLENYPEFLRQRRQLILQECRKLFTATTV